MIRSRRRHLPFLLVSGFIVAALGASPEAAQAAWPERAITLLVPFPPGGATDIVTRALAEPMAKALGQPVVVENKPGANTSIAAHAAATAKADGYTLMTAAGSTLVLNPMLYEKLSYNPERDLDVIALVADIPLIAVVPATSTMKSLDDLIAQAKQKDGAMTYASVGIGSTLHLTGELFLQDTGVKMTHVPYKGSAAAMTDVVGGRVDLIFDAPSTAVPQVDGGRLRALAVTSAQRVPYLPNVPALAERFPGFEAIVWYSIVSPKGLPAEVRTKLKSAIDQALLTPGFIQAAERGYLTPAKPATAEQISARLNSERKRWGDLIRKQGIRLEQN